MRRLGGSVSCSARKTSAWSCKRSAWRHVTGAGPGERAGVGAQGERTDTAFTVVVRLERRLENCPAPGAHFGAGREIKRRRSVTE